MLKLNRAYPSPAVSVLPIAVVPNLERIHPRGEFGLFRGNLDFKKFKQFIEDFLSSCKLHVHLFIQTIFCNLSLLLHLPSVLFRVEVKQFAKLNRPTLAAMQANLYKVPYKHNKSIIPSEYISYTK